jgi:hypothetical protein
MNLTSTLPLFVSLGGGVGGKDGNGIDNKQKAGDGKKKKGGGGGKKTPKKAGDSSSSANKKKPKK